MTSKILISSSTIFARKNPFAAGCRGISAKRSQLPAAMQTLQQGDGRSAEQIPINSRYRGNYAARLSPPVAELIITNQWLIAECAYNRLSPTLDSFLSSDAYYQHQNEAGERVPEERQTVRLQN